MSWLGFLVFGAIIASATGCKMNNPAFELYDGDENGSGDDDGDGDDDGAGTGDETGADPGDAVCELDFEGLRLVRYLIPSNIECEELLDVWMVAVEVTPDGLVLEGPCSPGCEDCENRGAVLLGANDDPTGAVPVCLHLHNERPFPAMPDRCNWGGTTVWPTDDSHPLLVLSAAAYGTPGDARDFLAGLRIETETLDECECLEAQGCCNPAKPPQQLKLLVNDTPVHEGEGVLAIIGEWEYAFFNVQSHATGECGEPSHIGWSLALQP